MKKIILHGRKVVGGCTEGEALVTRETISGWGGIDPIQGTITERRHELRGSSFTGKVLVFPGAKGSSGGNFTAYSKSIRRASSLSTRITKLDISQFLIGSFFGFILPPPKMLHLLINVAEKLLKCC